MTEPPDFEHMKAAQVFQRLKAKDPAATACTSRVVADAFERLRPFRPAQDAIAKMTATERRTQDIRRRFAGETEVDRAVRRYIDIKPPQSFLDNMQRFSERVSAMMRDNESPFQELEDDRRRSLKAIAAAERAQIEREHRMVEAAEASAAALRELEERVRLAEERARQAEARELLAERRAEEREREVEARERRNEKRARWQFGFAVVSVVGVIVSAAVNVL